MTATELLPLLQDLKRSEKLFIMQFLISDLVQEESKWLQPDQTYPIWSPYDAYDAADVMLNTLKEAKKNAPA